ncbi:hypothetical protein B1812_10925 [Methylocystis bryophila]|uniref:Uncharacterized protein n=1 Tax=Methylocystis bryophila TaxID=655015 RepID=A0A1W6MV70_9HYPH|nr:hypothetical protein B1812_10925 [Methylocystis bryophila]
MEALALGEIGSRGLSDASSSDMILSHIAARTDLMRRATKAREADWRVFAKIFENSLEQKADSRHEA